MVTLFTETSNYNEYIKYKLLPLFPPKFESFGHWKCIPLCTDLHLGTPEPNPNPMKQDSF